MPSVNTGPYGHGGGPGCPPSPRLVPPLRWRQIVAGEEARLAAVRAWVAALLPACRARDDVITVANELCANAVRHTASGRGGTFGVEITVCPPVVRVSVADAGGEQEPRVIECPAGESGRGLLLVRGLSARLGMAGDHRGRLVWADIPWNGPAPAARMPGPYQAAILAGEAALAGRYPGAGAWFGRPTAAWWAVVAGELVTALSVVVHSRRRGI